MKTVFKNKLFLFWLPVLLYAGLIFYLSSIPLPAGPQIFPHQDKITHAIEYAIFGLLLARAFKNTYRLSGGVFVFLISLLSLLYGLSDEFHQMFVPMRDPSLMDAFSDGIGGFLGCLFYKRNIG